MATDGAFADDGSGNPLFFTASVTNCMEEEDFLYFLQNQAVCEEFGSPDEIQGWPFYKSRLGQMRAVLAQGCISRAFFLGYNEAATNCFDPAVTNHCPIISNDVENCEICEGEEETSAGSLETGTGETGDGRPDDIFALPPGGN